MQDFRNLSVWQMARRLTKSIYEMTVDYPESEAFGLRSQMRRASVSICSNIAEGCGRRGDREFRRFLDVAMGSACELECETILSFDLAFITETAQEQILDVLIQTKRMLGGLLACLGWGRSKSGGRETAAGNRRPRQRAAGARETDSGTDS
ncbi:MAG: four helix bundle protein [Acidobacteriia bacterium]|nr:four helix bundle protein [Terriglobia bacterium]